MFFVDKFLIFAVSFCADNSCGVFDYQVKRKKSIEWWNVLLKDTANWIQIYLRILVSAFIEYIKGMVGGGGVVFVYFMAIRYE